MPVQTPRCSHDECQNKTWDGLCHVHRNAPATRFTPQLSGNPGGVGVSYDALQTDSIASLWDSAARTFPDIGDLVHPYVVREQVRSTLRAAVSAEVVRRGPGCDQGDVRMRDEMLSRVGADVGAALRVEPNTLTADEALEVQHSSTDMLGRGAEESRALASYGLRVEWQLGRMMGYEVDEDGVPYGAPFPQYCAAASRSLEAEVAHQYRRELDNWVPMIQAYHGRPPVSPEPLPAALVAGEGDLMVTPPQEVEAEVWEAAVAEDEAAREARREARVEMTKRGLRGLAVGVLKAADMGLKAHEDSRARAAAREDARYRRDMGEYVRRSNEAARRRRWS